MMECPHQVEELHIGLVDSCHLPKDTSDDLASCCFASVMADLLSEVRLLDTYATARLCLNASFLFEKRVECSWVLLQRRVQAGALRDPGAAVTCVTFVASTLRRTIVWGFSCDILQKELLQYLNLMNATSLVASLNEIEVRLIFAPLSGPSCSERFALEALKSWGL